jgi:FtsH-binding integral membrane protein
MNVNTENSYRTRKQLMWGLLLVGLGGTLLLDQLGMLDVYDLWHYWPLLLVVVGINKMIGYPTARDFSGGLWTLFIGVWLFANFEHMFGMSFRNSWPYLIIAWGITLILRPFIRERFALNAASKESSHED